MVNYSFYDDCTNVKQNNQDNYINARLIQRK